jgi:hypothetical protein
MTTWKAAIVGLLLLSVGVLVLGTPTEPVNIELILDASSSMSESVAGAIKIEAAKQAIIDLLDTLPDGCNVGLRVYGHTYDATEKDNSCVDTEVLWKIQSLDEGARDEIKTILAGIEAKGMTPIAYSLEQAMTDFEGKTGTNSIILISDGKETCGGNPESIADEIHQLTNGLKIYVIGFDVSSDEQLRSIASKADGEYYPAADATELASTLKEAVQEVVQEATSKPPFVFVDDFDRGPKEEWDQAVGTWSAIDQKFTALDTEVGQWYVATLAVPSLTRYTMEVDVYLGIGAYYWKNPRYFYQLCGAMIVAKGALPDEHRFYVRLEGARDDTRKMNLVAGAIDNFDSTKVDLVIDSPIHVKIEVNDRVVTIYLSSKNSEIVEEEPVLTVYVLQAETVQIELKLVYYSCTGGRLDRGVKERNAFDNFRIEEMP